MKKRKNTPNAELVALLASIRDQIEDSFDELGVEPDESEDEDCDCEDNGDEDD
jgi:hypothetical protein